jgi:hypothetical protein
MGSNHVGGRSENRREGLPTGLVHVQDRTQEHQAVELKRVFLSIGKPDFP